MEKYENYEKYDMIKIYIQCGENSTAAANLYLETFPERRQPDKRIFARYAPTYIFLISTLVTITSLLLIFL